jgi:glutaredoxin
MSEDLPANPPATVVAYTTSWCPDCTRSKRVLHKAGIPYVEIDIEKVPGSEDAMRTLNGGSGKVPTLLIRTEAGQVILIEPSDRELTEALRTANQRATPSLATEQSAP